MTDVTASYDYVFEKYERFDITCQILPAAFHEKLSDLLCF